jgi:hypothetical protein
MNGLYPDPIRARAFSGLLLLPLILCGAGCSDNKPLTVKGSVSYQGKPIPAGIVKFYGSGNRSSMAYVRDGAFTVTDLPPGEVKVTVEPDGSSEKGKGAAKAVVIPKKYANPETAGLVFTITRQTRELAINLD